MKQHNLRGIFTPKLTALLLAGALALACAGWLWLQHRKPPPDTPVAEIWVDGTLYQSINLSAAPNGTFSIQGDTGKPVSFEIREGAIRFVEVTCPDHICENTGFVRWEGQSAICMPNRVVLTITAG